VYLKSEKKVKHVLKIRNVELSTKESKPFKKLKKIFYVEEFKIKVMENIHKIDKNCRFFETNIFRSARFTTHNKLRFLESIMVTGKKLEVISGSTFEIPIYLITTKNLRKYKKRYLINQHYELSEGGKCNWDDQANKIIMCWDNKENVHNGNDFNDPKFQNSVVLYLKDLCINFLRIGSELHKKKIKIDPKDYYFLREVKPVYQNDFYEKRWEIMRKVFEKYFQQLLFLTKLLHIPIHMLLKIPNRKMISDMIFLAGKDHTSSENEKNLICAPPKKMKKYESNSLIKKFVDESFVCCKKDEILQSLDYSSMYPCMMLMLFEKDYKLNPYFSMIKSIYELKSKEKNIQKKIVLKIILNAIYGGFGTTKSQFMVCADPGVAKLVCTEARALLEKTIEYYNLKTTVVYCNTDSIVVKGKPKTINSLTDFWNRTLMTGKYKFTKLKVERTGSRFLMFNKQVRIWTIDKEKSFDLIGSFFNSTSVPAVIRNCIGAILGCSMYKSKSLEDFRKQFEHWSDFYMNSIKTLNINELNELMIVTRVRTNRTKYKLIDKKGDNKLDLRFTINLFSSFDDSIVQQDYGTARDLINVKTRNFQLEKRLIHYIDNIKDLLRKI